MLINSVIIILREVLEAVLMLSVLMAVSRVFGLGIRWAAFAIGLGIVGASLYAASMQSVSEWLDGVGQEVVDASLQLLTFAALCGCVFLLVRAWGRRGQSADTLVRLMTAATAIAITREGAEIFVFVSGFLGSEFFLTGVASGSLIGAAIGCSIGALFYYLLLEQPQRRLLPLTSVLLVLIGCGMSAQAVRLLIQADFLSAAEPLWDTSFIVREQSLPGQLLYALVGYEASPSAIEVAVYAASLATMLALALLARGQGRRAGEERV